MFFSISAGAACFHLADPCDGRPSGRLSEVVAAVSGVATPILTQQEVVAAGGGDGKGGNCMVRLGSQLLAVSPEPPLCVDA